MPLISFRNGGLWSGLGSSLQGLYGDMVWCVGNQGIRPPPRMKCPSPCILSASTSLLLMGWRFVGGKFSEAFFRRFISSSDIGTIVNCRKKRLNWAAEEVLPLPEERSVVSFALGFGCVLYVPAFFCYPLPQFAVVNLTIRCRCLYGNPRVLRTRVRIP